MVEISGNLDPVIDKKESHRVIAYVDGYNLFYAVRNKWAEPKGKKREKNSNLIKYHLEKLVLCCLEKVSKETKIKNLKITEIKKIKFYTARPLSLEEIDIKLGKGKSEGYKDGLNVADYEQWTERQRNEGVDIVEGVYRHGSGKFKEKQSDVNLAVGMLSGAFEEDGYDKAVLISDDTDYCGLIVKCLSLGKHVLVLGTERHIKKELCGGELHSSECEQYIENGALTFCLIEEDDIKECLDDEYIKQTRGNQSNDKKTTS